RDRRQGLPLRLAGRHSTGNRRAGRPLRAPPGCAIGDVPMRSGLGAYPDRHRATDLGTVPEGRSDRPAVRRAVMRLDLDRDVGEPTEGLREVPVPVTEEA